MTFKFLLASHEQVEIGVQDHVFFLVWVIGEAPPTDLTGKWFFPSVYSHVHLETTIVVEHLLADFTLVALLCKTHKVTVKFCLIANFCKIHKVTVKVSLIANFCKTHKVTVKYRLIANFCKTLKVTVKFRLIANFCKTHKVTVNFCLIGKFCKTLNG